MALRLGRFAAWATFQRTGVEVGVVTFGDRVHCRLFEGQAV